MVGLKGTEVMLMEMAQSRMELTSRPLQVNCYDEVIPSVSCPVLFLQMVELKGLPAEMAQCRMEPTQNLVLIIVS